MCPVEQLLVHSEWETRLHIMMRGPLVPLPLEVVTFQAIWSFLSQNHSRSCRGSSPLSLFLLSSTKHFLNARTICWAKGCTCVVGETGKDTKMNQTELAMKQHIVYWGRPMYSLLSDAKRGCYGKGEYWRGEPPIIQHCFFRCILSLHLHCALLGADISCFCLPRIHFSFW